MNKRGGFTLTELIVAMSLFTIGISIATGAFVRALRVQRSITHLMSVNSNTSLVLEQMAREIRTGYGFSSVSSAGSCSLGGDELKFTNAKGNEVTYSYFSSEILRQECSGSNCSGALSSPLTASDVTVKKACFVVNQQNAITDPWRVTISLETGSSKPDLATNFINLETTISSRVLPSDIAP